MSVGDLTERDDRPAYVRFERRAVENKRLSLEKGRSVSTDVDIALITPPYSKDLVELKIDRFFESTERDVKNGRTSKEHLDYWRKAYEAFKNGQEAPLNGTPIKEWSAISPAQIKNLIAINILTIEDLAGVNDQGMSRIGMGAHELQKKAINWLRSADDRGEITLKITQLEIENERLKLANESLVEKNQLLNNQMAQFAQTANVAQAPIQPVGITADDIMPDEDRPPVVGVAVEPVITDYTNASRDQLIGAHIKKFGKAPHHLSKDDTIRNKLTA